MILITTLAKYQTEFWLPVSKELQRRGQTVAVLAFDDRSVLMLRTAGIPVQQISRLAGVDTGAATRLPQRLRDYDIDNPNLMFSHERITFRILDGETLARTFMRYSDAVEAALDRLGAGGEKAVMVQELGGFLSVIASYFAARHRNIDNWFIEPSFFRGRLTFRRNSFAAGRIGEVADEVSAPLEAYLADTLSKRSIVIPEKDRHQYRSVFNKVLNLRNAGRIFEKLFDKYVLGMHQDFGHIGTHVLQHMEMVGNALLARPLQQPLPAGRFVYFPFHVPGDMALTLRSPEYLDQFALVDYLLRVVPPSHRVVVKEHPAQIGALAAGRLRELARRYDNLTILSPQTNNFEVLSRADAIVSVNSKSGAEALLLGKPVVVLGDAFYSDCPFVLRADGLNSIAVALREALALPPRDPEPIRRYFQSVYGRSYPGELYISRPENVATFVDSLLTAISGDSSGGPKEAAPKG